MIKSAVISLGGQAQTKQITEWIIRKYGDVNPNTIRTQISACSVNQPSRIHLPECNKPRTYDPRYDFLYNIGRGQVELYDSVKHGTWELVEHDGKTVIAKNGVPVLSDSSTSLLDFLQNESRMYKNYQPIVIKTLLEKDADENFTTSFDEIKKKIKALNFDREDFDITNAIDAVSSALKKYVSFSKQFVSLNPDCFSKEDIPKCLDICNKEIAKFHVKIIMNNDNNVYVIQAGQKGEWLQEFQGSKTAGISYHEYANFDLTGMTKDEIENKTNGKSGTELYDISQIKKGDVVAITLGQKKGITNFGIVTSEYFFDSKSTTYAHRVGVEYLNFGAPEITSDSPKAIFKTTNLELQIKDFLLGLNNHKYFLLRHNPDSPWDDVEGNKYNFGKTVPNQKKLRDAGIGTKTIWFTKQDGEYYFWGYGIIKDIETVQENEKWNLVYDEFTFFKRENNSLEINDKFLKKGSESVKQQIQNIDNFNNQHAILQITKKIYDDIITNNIAVFSKEYQTRDGTLNLDPYLQALHWKPNLILYGPPGTGKTYYATEIAEQLTSANFSPLIQPSSVYQMSDDEYGNFVIESIKKEAEANGYAFRVNKEKYNFVLEHNDDKIHIRFTYSKSTTNNKNDCYCGIDDSVISFLKQAPEYNRYIVTVNNSARNFVVLPYSIEQKHAKFAGTTNSENWDPTGVNAHSYHIIIYDNDASFGGTNYDCKKFVRNIKQIFNPVIKIITFHQTLSYEEFIEGIKVNPTKDNLSVIYDVEPGIFKKFCKVAENDDPKNKYVLIIDEINRGNIAKIFGELITIIEKDKRGKQVTLAYSKEKFSVPNNVYIVGTMNTADQSLTHLDAALKRRFTMIEHYPDSDILKHHKLNGEIDLTDLLDAINNKLIENNFRDGQIGHSYFMDGNKVLTKISDLQMVFAHDIIPLLRDYFYDDESKLMNIFGDHWFDKNKDINKDWQGSVNIGKFRDNIKKSFGV